MILSCKYKLIPNKTQEKVLISWVNTCRALYNLALEEKIYAYKSHQKNISKYDQYNELPLLKKEHKWIAEVYSDVLQETLDRLDKAYIGFFNKGGFPKFKSKKDYNSFTFKRSFSIKNNKIKFPKIGEIKFHNSKNITNLKTATIIKENNNWFVSITYETQEKPTIIDNSNAVGIDAGCIYHSVTSDAQFVDSPKFLHKSLKEIRILNRKLSKQKKNSNNRKKTIILLQTKYTKLKNQRKDFNHKLSNQITNDYTSIYIENLNIQNMIKFNKGIAKSLLDNSFYNFRLQLEYKSKLKGKYFKAVPAQYTSQTCSKCGNVDKNSRTSQSLFKCTSCNLELNADFNAALNIKAKGISYSTQSKIII